jgi:hypothetical protein
MNFKYFYQFYFSKNSIHLKKYPKTNEIKALNTAYINLKISVKIINIKLSFVFVQYWLIYDLFGGHASAFDDFLKK